MSQQRASVVVSFKASGATISAYRIMKPGTAANSVALWDTQTALMIGLSQQDSVGGVGSSVMVAIGGTGRVQAGASISAGALVTGTTTGLAIADATNGFVDTVTSATVPYNIGIALDAADTNSVCEVLIQPRHFRMDL